MCVMATAILGPPYTGGIKKFQDPLVDLKSVLAKPDPNVFAGSDYYEIALWQHQSPELPELLRRPHCAATCRYPRYACMQRDPTPNTSAP